jgi:hypothetical protein
MQSYSQDQDFYLNQENDVEDNEFSLYDQIGKKFLLFLFINFVKDVYAGLFYIYMVTLVTCYWYETHNKQNAFTSSAHGAAELFVLQVGQLFRANHEK